MQSELVLLFLLVLILSCNNSDAERISIIISFSITIIM